jgi:nucleotide-binding universal stress UspA family protein
MSAISQGDRRRSDGDPAFFAKRAVATPAEPQVLGRDRCRVLACVDGETATATTVLGHARALAIALDLTVTVGRVVETSRNADAPADPLEWQIRRGEYERELEQLATSEGGKNLIESVLLTGHPAVELREWSKRHGATLIAIATHERVRHPVNGLGSTAKEMLDETSASMLLVPPGETSEDRIAYRRLLIPLDGSLRAESVIPIAARIARTHDAEILLAYVVPRPDLVQASLDEVRGRALRGRLERHNEQRARKYLDELRVRLWRDRLPTRSIVVTHGEPRASIHRLAIEQHIDLIILSSHGGSEMSDVPCGSVTEYLATHAPAPMLIVRPNFAHTFSRAAVSPDNVIAN